MAGLPDPNVLQLDLTRGLAQAAIRGGVKAMLDSNALPAAKDAQLTHCLGCSGDGVMTVESTAPGPAPAGEHDNNLAVDRGIIDVLADLVSASVSRLQEELIKRGFDIPWSKLDERLTRLIERERVRTIPATRDTFQHFALTATGLVGQRHRKSVEERSGGLTDSEILKRIANNVRLCQGDAEPPLHVNLPGIVRALFDANRTQAATIQSLAAEVNSAVELQNDYLVRARDAEDTLPLVRQTVDELWSIVKEDPRVWDEGTQLPQILESFIRWYDEASERANRIHDEQEMLRKRLEVSGSDVLALTAERDQWMSRAVEAERLLKGIAAQCISVAQPDEAVSPVLVNRAIAAAREAGRSEERARLVGLIQGDDDEPKGDTHFQH